MPIDQRLTPISTAPDSLDKSDEQALGEIAKRLGLSQAKAHILFCAGDKCCSAEVGLQLWDHLKKNCAGLAKAEIFLNRTKATCLRLCRNGPILVVYPQGVWYAKVTESKIDEILRAVAEDLPLPAGSFLAAPIS